jgi:glutathione synthase/RimK-type ligase-like ATP-grasp enzyme
MNSMNDSSLVSKRPKLYIYIDYRGQFYSSLRVSTGGVDLDLLQDALFGFGLECEIRTFSSFRSTENFDGAFVLYQSSEDRDLLYKSYIADVLLSISARGGVLLPKFEYFHAHENKVFQSYMTSSLSIPGLKIPKSVSYGCYEELKDVPSNLEFPLVLKSAAGCQSKSVTLVRSHAELYAKAARFSSSFNLLDAIRIGAKKYLRKGYVRESLRRRKFILQEFIPDLDGDFKVLVYGERVYVLTRKNRKNDFRASGSGIFAFTEDVPHALLDVALRLREHYECPYISADIAYERQTGTCILLEIQFLMFGTYTIEKSPFHFVPSPEGWKVVRQSSVLEHVMANSIAGQIVRASNTAVVDIAT